jgi:hypothetical protein
MSDPIAVLRRLRAAERWAMRHMNVGEWRRRDNYVVFEDSTGWRGCRNAPALADPAARKALYDKAAAIWMKDRPLLSLWYRQLFTAHSTKVQGFVLYPDGLVRLVNVKIQ